FCQWLTTPSYRGGKWFEDLDLSSFPDSVTL
ncbi:unnamed protein product, partial [marine sediment metagenome]